MRKSILPAACLMLISMSLFGQTRTLPISENKYRINLPDYWRNGHKVWKTLADKLPLTCEELKDKELCGDDCNPKYTVELYITEPANFAYDFRYIQPPAYTGTRH